jgi:serine/threonine protein kinase
MLMCAKQGNIKESYFFEKKVGSGGFGVVYSAKNKLTKKRVAIKVVHKFKINDVKIFKKEYGTLSKVDHPNIINVHEIWEWDKMLFIVTDFCYGGELFDYVLERNYLSEKETRIIMK